MTDRPGEHPEPHADLDARKPLIQVFPAGTKIFRTHGRLRPPLFFGRSGNNRFDSPDGEFGVLYAGMDEHCAFIETFGQDTGVHAVSGAMLTERPLAEIELLKPLTLIDLKTTGGLARIGADVRLLGGPHRIAQRWSQALHNHPIQPDGILYPARHDPARNACAIFEQDAEGFRPIPRGSLMDATNRKLLAAILDCYQFGLILDE